MEGLNAHIERFSPFLVSISRFVYLCVCYKHIDTYMVGCLFFNLHTLYPKIILVIKNIPQYSMSEVN